MDLYNTIATWTGWPVIVSVLLLGLGYGYWAMENRIAILKDKIELLETELSIAKQFVPDRLLENLAKRHKLISQELEILNNEKDKNLEAIADKERELNAIRQNLEKSNAVFNQIEQDLEEDFLEKELPLPDFPRQFCPHCYAPVVSRYTHTVRREDPDFYFDYYVLVYECGLEVMEGGQIMKECSRTSSPS